MATHIPATDTLELLQGVWYPTLITEDGQVTWEGEPVFPAGSRPWLMTVVRDTFHITADADYYATGGRLRLDPTAGRLVFEYPPLHPEFDSHCAYRLTGDDLEVTVGGFEWSGPHDAVGTTQYRRVAATPTPEMMALIEQSILSWCRYPEREVPNTPRSTDDEGS